MGNATHSPAPWEFLEAHSHNDEWSASRPLTICCADNEDVANVFSHNDSTVSITRETAIANAHLIAAAPEMLEALVSALPYIEAAEEDDAYKPGAVAKITKQIREAIGKAGAK